MKTTSLVFFISLILVACFNQQSKKAEIVKTMNLPEFKYNPNACKLGIIDQDTSICPVCLKPVNYIYTGPFYTTREIDGICPWCIKDGSASKKFDGAFQDFASCEEVKNMEYVDELITRTPGYSSWQQARWLSHCGDFCALTGYVGWKEVSELKEELKEDIEQIKSDYRLSQEELEKNLINNGSFQGYLFQCLHCKKHRLIVDMN